ncbi:hypothetical protein D7B24_003400 [Verticillium nonalfalfae]|uniref:Uncharacterized protein n=1 Tax=Verticillium nonalfalfae TaxID=1051616 RepID=A0A3M9Y024_9PEZI|nr:uncharacterized protein D7B24_003400 [Verticillium nonalfalfae]RNJ52490.1 hypothetical protein D7B24_003400 [Verticillium nonalfalfae]
MSTVRQKDINVYEAWLKAVPVIDTVAAVVTIPFVSALLAYGAAAHVERKNKKQELTMRQLLGLADRNWVTMDPTHLHRAAGDRSAFLYIATLFVLISAIQLPLRTYLAPIGSRPAIFARDTSSTGARSLAFDIDPGTIPEIPRQPLLNVMDERLRTLTSRSIQPQLWRSNGTSQTMDAGEGFNFAPVSADAFWVSSVPSGSTTGGLRMRSLRLNSSSECASIAADEFPSNCSGQFPFLTNYTGNGISIRVCVPDGKDGKPWGATRDRQDIEEEMYLDAKLASDAGDATLNDDLHNFTIRCVGRSTMGYFELGNLYNQEQPSELLAQWLDPNETNDFDDYFAESPLTSDSNYDRPGTASSPPGPLQMAAEVLFGPQSYHHTLLQLLRSTETSVPGSLCSALKPPLAGIDYPRPPAWVESMASTCNATSVSKESLTTEAYNFVHTDRAYGLRRIVDKPPVNFRGVDVSHASMIAASVLLGVQVLLLILLTLTLRLPPFLPDFFTAPVPGARARNPANSSATAPPFTATAPPRYEEAVRSPGHSSYFLPNPPPGISAGPYDLRNVEHRRVLARLRLLPDDPSHADPARGITPAPPPGSLFRRGALAGYRPWWEGGRTGGGDVFSGAMTASAERDESAADDGVEVEGDEDEDQDECEVEDGGERWETISTGEAEDAEEEHLRWETLRARERGFVSSSRRCV